MCTLKHSGICLIAAALLLAACSTPAAQGTPSATPVPSAVPAAEVSGVTQPAVTGTEAPSFIPSVGKVMALVYEVLQRIPEKQRNCRQPF